ncbi:MAG: glycosyl transferase [Flavobacteriaceae bacterium]|nr:glycosyl transferase [Flavobacteriaceae bacterium]|tara:strand:+ start:25219 stop:26103 length:885 start_codon:yes stop_codon:yes gene_type:complete
MISILIPTYNYKIVALVSEVHKQFSEIKAAFEIRVYEDGSSHFLEENTNIQELKNVVYKQFSENKGRTATRNLLANDASYDWLLFLDADVLPKNSDFIATYLKAVEINDDPVIFGGITYVLEAPEKSKRLRWVYGKEREAKFPSERRKNPFYIISQNLLIQKEVFLQCNTLHGNHYGLDLFFSYQLKRLGYSVAHIDNPIIHLGLENSEDFLKKSLRAIDTLIDLENKGMMERDFTSLQKAYLSFKKKKILNGAYQLGGRFKKKIERQLCSSNPNLRLFDLYRLHYYFEKKSHA